jgi:hypothetical protein
MSADPPAVLASPKAGVGNAAIARLAARSRANLEKPGRPGPERHGYALAHFDATVNALRTRNNDGHLDTVLARMEDARQTVPLDPDFDWGTVIPDEDIDEVAEVIGEVDVSEDS